MYKLYTRLADKELILELWGSSTKHPDSIFFFSNFKKCSYIDEELQIFQWILECASKLTLPIHARELTDFAIMCYDMILEGRKFSAQKKG